MIEKKTPRIGVFGFCMIMVAYTVTLNVTTTGATIVRDMSVPMTWFCFLIGCIFLIFTGMLSGNMGLRERVTTDAVWKYCYGTAFTSILSVVLSLCLILWMCFDAYYSASAAEMIFGAGKGWIFVIGVVVTTLITWYGLTRGVETLAILGKISLPFAGVIYVVLMYFIFKQGGGWKGVVVDYKPLGVMGMGTAINIIASQYMCMAGMWGDLACEVDVKKSVNIGIVVGFTVHFLMGTLGVLGYVVTGAYGINAVALALGGVANILTNIFCFLAINNSQPSTVHIASNLFHGSLPVKKRTCDWIIPIVLAAGALYIRFVSSLDIFSQVASFVGAVMGPSVGVSLCDYWLCKGGTIDMSDAPRKVCPNGLISILLGVVVAVIFTYIIPGMPGGLIGCFGAALIRWLMHAIAPKLD